VNGPLFASVAAARRWGYELCGSDHDGIHVRKPTRTGYVFGLVIVPVRTRARAWIPLKRAATASGS